MTLSGWALGSSARHVRSKLHSSIMTELHDSPEPLRHNARSRFFCASSQAGSWHSHSSHGTSSHEHDDRSAKLCHAGVITPSSVRPLYATMGSMRRLGGRWIVCIGIGIGGLTSCGQSKKSKEREDRAAPPAHALAPTNPPNPPTPTVPASTA